MANSRHLENWTIAVSHDDADRSLKQIGRPPSWIFKQT